MLNNYIDLTQEATDGQMFNIDTERIIELEQQLNVTAAEIANEFKKYIYDGRGEYSGKTGMHAGSVFQRMLLCARSDQEELLILFLLKEIFESVSNRIELKMVEVGFNKYKREND